MLAIACTVENKDDPFAIDSGGTDAVTDTASGPTSMSTSVTDTSPTSAEGTASMTDTSATATEGDTDAVGECGEGAAADLGGEGVGEVQPAGPG